MSFQWFLNWVELGGAVTSTLDGATHFDRGDAISCAVTPHDGSEAGATVTSLAVTIANTAPTLLSASLGAGPYRTDDTLSCTATGFHRRVDAIELIQRARSASRQPAGFQTWERRHGSRQGRAMSSTRATGSRVVGSHTEDVWAWGENTFGQVGSGLAKAWGHNASGQLGTGNTTNSASPVNVVGVTDAKALAAGAQHVLALRPGCPVWAWGHNGQGQLGTGSTSATQVTAPGVSLLVNTFYFDGDMDGFGNEFIAEQAASADC